MVDSMPSDMIKFVESAKKGAYAKVRESDLRYVRIREVTRYVENSDDDFYFGIR